MNLVNDEGLGCNMDVPFTLAIIDTVYQVRVDVDPFPSCIQQGVTYKVPVRLAGGFGKYTLTLEPTIMTHGALIGVSPDLSPGISARLLTANAGILEFNIPTGGVYYATLVARDQLGNEAQLVLKFIVQEYCPNKPLGLRNTSEKSPATMVKEAWHQKNMVTLLPEILRG
jgi:hypothetical protein